MVSSSPPPAMVATDPNKYPRGAFFILAGYLLERLVYYGMFGGAVFYLQRVLHFSASESSTIKSILEGLIYLAPVLGAVIADSFFGKFRLVFTMCCGYVFGTIIFSLSSATPLMTSLSLAKATGIGGLLIFGLCAGLMKAVYSSLGPDQFPLPEQRPLQQRYFYLFYWMINAGAFCGQLLTAQLRDTVQCFGSDCFLLPFSILVGLMMLSTGIFYAGKRHYREAPPDPMMVRAIKCVGRAIKMSFSRDARPVDHWLDRATLPGEGAVTDLSLVANIKKTMRVILLFTTYPLFWALFYQTSTGMIFQAKRLTDRIGSYRIPPELTSSVNPLLILVLIPVFDLVFYPLLNRFHLLKTATSRMTAGMLFAVASFIIYGVINMQVEQTILGSGQASVQFYNTRPCEVTVQPWQERDVQWVIPPSGQILETITLNDGDNGSVFRPKVSEDCGVNRSQLQEVNIILREKHQTTVIMDSVDITILESSLHYIKDKDAEAKVRISSLSTTHSTTIEEFVLNYHDMNVSVVVSHGVSEFKRLPPQSYRVINVKTNQDLGLADVRQDGVYDIVLSSSSNITVFAMTAPSALHVLWTIPQYLVLTVAEILFSISGMDFAYTEAPDSMKSVMQATNLFTITVGLWIFAILNSLSSATGIFLHMPSREAFAYSALMLIDTMVFFVLVKRYYSNIKAESRRKRKAESVQKNPEGTVNTAFEEEQI